MVHGDLFCEVCRLHSETSWWDELVVYVIGGASRCESESGSVGECRASHLEHTNRRAGMAKELLDYINCG